MLVQLVLFIFFFRVKEVFTLGVGESDSLNSIVSDKAGLNENSVSDILKKILNKGCAKKYTLTCFKMDMVELMDTLSASNSYQLFPGVTVVKDATSNGTIKQYPEKLMKSLVNQFPNQENSQLDEFLISKIYEFLSSHSLRLRFMEPSIKLGEKELNKSQGRGKGPKSSLMAGIMMLKGTLMTLGFGALAGLAGKALLTSLLSLVISAIIGLRSNGFQRQTTYEIISKPLYSHSHSHSAELHDHHDHAHYSYGRNLESNNENNGGIHSDVEYVPLPHREEEEEEKMHPNPEGYHYNAYGEVEYKTITEDDLKAYYSNLQYNRQKRPQIFYRRGKSLSENKKPVERFDSATFVPISTVLNPALKKATE